MKWTASPQKDNEVVIFNPQNDLCINHFIGAVYTLYALQSRCRFLNNNRIVSELINGINSLPDEYWAGWEQEREALNYVVVYLSEKWAYERSVSAGILDELTKKPHISPYNGVMLYSDVMSCPIEGIKGIIYDLYPNEVSRVILRCL